MLYRSSLDRTIDRAHSRIAGCEMSLAHAYTHDSIASAESDLERARDWLARAERAKAEWNATEHGDYDEMPDVPEFFAPALLE